MDGSGQPRRQPSRSNLHSALLLPAVSFLGGFQRPSGPKKTRAHPSGRYLKPFTRREILSLAGMSVPGGGSAVPDEGSKEESRIALGPDLLLSYNGILVGVFPNGSKDAAAITNDPLERKSRTFFYDDDTVIEMYTTYVMI